MVSIKDLCYQFNVEDRIEELEETLIVSSWTDPLGEAHDIYTMGYQPEIHNCCSFLKTIYYAIIQKPSERDVDDPIVISYYRNALLTKVDIYTAASFLYSKADSYGKAKTAMAFAGLYSWLSEFDKDNEGRHERPVREPDGEFIVKMQRTNIGLCGQFQYISKMEIFMKDQFNNRKLVTMLDDYHYNPELFLKETIKYLNMGVIPENINNSVDKYTYAMSMLRDTMRLNMKLSDFDDNHHVGYREIHYSYWDNDNGDVIGIAGNGQYIKID